MKEREKWRIEIPNEGVRWAGSSENAIIYLAGFVNADVKRDYGDCFMKKTSAEKIIACVYDCPNCDEKRKGG